MKGSVLGFDAGSNTGAISGFDGQRYQFARIEWKGAALPKSGDEVDFQINGDRAVDIYCSRGVAEPFSWKRHLFSFDGRSTRSDYWLRFCLPYTVALIVAMIIDIAMVSGSSGEPSIGVLTVLLYLAGLWPSLAVGIKRCHDRNRSGWFVLVGLIPFIGGIWLLVELGFLRGTIGDNRFGPDAVAA